MFVFVPEADNGHFPGVQFSFSTDKGWRGQIFPGTKPAETRDIADGFVFLSGKIIKTGGNNGNADFIFHIRINDRAKYDIGVFIGFFLNQG